MRRCSNWASFTRTAFEDAIRARAEALVETISRALAGIPAAAGLQAIVLTGGSTQIPLLQRLLRRSASGPLEWTIAATGQNYRDWRAARLEA